MEPTIAVILNRDLLFGSRIRNALATLGLQGRFVPDVERFVASLVALGEEATIGIIDMNGPVSWESLRESLSRDDWTVPTLAFGPHVDVDGRRAAKAAGVTRIVSNGQFHEEMSALIDRYRRR